LEVTYIREHLFSNVNIGRNPCRNQLNVEKLENFHVETSQISPDINILVTSKQ